MLKGPWLVRIKRGNAPLNLINYKPNWCKWERQVIWACNSIGRVSHLQCEGRRFDFCQVQRVVTTPPRGDSWLILT